MGAGKTWRRRFGCALALVLAPLLALALGQPMGEAMLPGAPGELEPDVGLRAAWEAPNWFAEEVVDVNGREELRANGDWSVVSFVEEGDGLPDRLVGERDAGGHWWPVAKKEYGRESRKEGGAHGSHSAAHGWATCYAWSFK